MRVTLLHATDMDLMDNALGQCYNQGPKETEDDKFTRLNKVCNLYKHDSLLEFGNATWEVETSAKCLLQLTRHRHASYAVKSTRYTLDKSELIFEKTGDPDIDLELSKYKDTIKHMMTQGKSNDAVSMMLPMAYQYRYQFQMNYRALKNFMHLRLDKHAQSEIRDLATRMFESLPLSIQKLIKQKGK